MCQRFNTGDIPTNPTDSRGSLPIFYSSQRIPILLVRHTAFGNCYWKKINSCFFSFAFVSHCQDRITRGCFYILQNAGSQNAGDCTILLHFFFNFPGGGGACPRTPLGTRATASHASLPLFLQKGLAGMR